MAIVDKFLKSTQGPIFDPVDNSDNEKIDKRDSREKAEEVLKIMIVWDIVGMIWDIIVGMVESQRQLLIS